MKQEIDDYIINITNSYEDKEISFEEAWDSILGAAVHEKPFWIPKSIYLRIVARQFRKYIRAKGWEQ